ncbi:Major facilitator superfamily domain general substrate transporter [Penicillium odoratum]|uniref:Major facilitator superfamily domain general substrate transporter n=1 Tax=Penicillium odoratum TaxID=1167516 RepID=UPI00254933E6|nr:Major facilitator superfamily domain general substrate transporter [Penicillium odoratum]KAJ5758582.1 Major facilitator superfamily domain general substrate transporter [Penicillium odoratum]
MTNYLIDTDSLFAVTAAATKATARASFGFAFHQSEIAPLSHNNLGTQWTWFIPAFLSLAFTPLPFIFLRVGSKLRAQSKFANEAKIRLAKLQEVRQNVEKWVDNKQTADNTISSDTKTVETQKFVSAIFTNQKVTLLTMQCLAPTEPTPSGSSSKHGIFLLGKAFKLSSVFDSPRLIQPMFMVYSYNVRYSANCNVLTRMEGRFVDDVGDR